MKMTVEYYMSAPYRLEITPDTEEGGYVACYPDLPGCITEGDTIEEAVGNAEEAKRLWITAAIDDGVEIYDPRSVNDYSGQFKLRMPKSLHKLLAEHARKEKTSMNQYCVYLLTRSDALKMG